MKYSILQVVSVQYHKRIAVLIFGKNEDVSSFSPLKKFGKGEV